MSGVITKMAWGETENEHSTFPIQFHGLITVFKQKTHVLLVIFCWAILIL